MSKEKDPNRFYVYLHRRGDNNEVFYVGKGQGYRAKSLHRSVWWHNVVAKCGYTVEYVEKFLSEESAFDLEIELIKFYRECGCDLVNHTDGGEGSSGYLHTEEWKIAQSERHKGRPLTPEHIQKLVIANTGKTHTAETRARLSEILTGRAISEETKEKMSKSRKGVKKSKEHSRKIGESNKGKVYSEEIIQHMRETKRHLAKSVRCSNDMFFHSLGDARRWLVSIGFESATCWAISEVCKHTTRNKAYGFGWEFMSEAEYLSSVEVNVTTNSEDFLISA